jgi:hypothetical protein
MGYGELYIVLAELSYEKLLKTPLGGFAIQCLVLETFYLAPFRAELLGRIAEWGGYGKVECGTQPARY